MPASEITSKKPSQIHISGPSDQPSGIPPVYLSVHTSTSPSIVPTALTSYIRSEKISDKPSINPLQAPTSLTRFVPSIQASDLPTHFTRV